MQVHTRKDAATAGLKKYWTGTPCRKGHEAMRYTLTGACSACVAGYRDSYRVSINEHAAATHGRATGLVTFTAQVHPLDVPAVLDLVDALKLARSLT